MNTLLKLKDGSGERQVGLFGAHIQSDPAVLPHYLQLEATKLLKTARQPELGQYLTPPPIADFMASLFTINSRSPVRLLDAGAGAGALTSAFLQRRLAEKPTAETHVVNYEIDSRLTTFLEKQHVYWNQQASFQNYHLKTDILNKDFVEEAVVQNGLFFNDSFTHAILNPPYKRIRKGSKHQRLLDSSGVNTTNLYSAFVALSVNMLEPMGEIVAILPRSFCNGPYYRSFRQYLLSRVSIRNIHLFGSRDRAFKEDGVLQENVIVCLTKGVAQGPVQLSFSTDANFCNVRMREVSFSEIVDLDDKERFIHIPLMRSEKNRHVRLFHSLEDLGISVSTGPIVDFRMKDHLRFSPSSDTVPLFYPAHFRGERQIWPIEGFKKYNAIVISPETQKWLYPNGFYAVTRRFSSKEEKRRVVASVVNPAKLDASHLGFENHLNIFHAQKNSLPMLLAYGLAAYLNTSLVDETFRRFSGHTQVNATDLKLLKYPSKDILLSLGKKFNKSWPPTQEELDIAIDGSL